MTATTANNFFGNTRPFFNPFADDWEPVKVQEAPCQTTDTVKEKCDMEPLISEWQKDLDEFIHTGAYSVAKNTIEKVQCVDSSLEPEIFPTEDNGLTLIFESSRSNRELTIVIPEDGSKRFFAAISLSHTQRQTGAIAHNIAVDNLAHWLSGDRSNISKLGLVLPSSSAK